MQSLLADFAGFVGFAAKSALSEWPCAEAKLLMRVIVGMWDVRGSKEPIRVLGLWLMRGRETYSPCASLGFEIGQKILRIMRAGIFVDRGWHGDCNGKS
tara:strand:+ start:4319 stop:4615 length:297 start_codon:yes stop_codon:yes gene_type:complete